MFEKAKPLLLVLLGLWGAWNLYSHGIFRRGIWPAVSSTLHHVPVFGSHFRHWRGSGEGGHSFAYGGHSYRRHYRYHHRRHHGRHHRRHRRHR